MAAVVKVVGVVHFRTYLRLSLQGFGNGVVSGIRMTLSA